jgi:DNA-binding response OmpR family regulator
VLKIQSDRYIYIKTFFVRELTARVKAQLRRYVDYNSNEVKNPILQHDELKLDTLNYKIFKNDQELSLRDTGE